MDTQVTPLHLAIDMYPLLHTYVTDMDTQVTPLHLAIDMYPLLHTYVTDMDTQVTPLHLRVLSRILALDSWLSLARSE